MFHPYSYLCQLSQAGDEFQKVKYDHEAAKRARKEKKATRKEAAKKKGKRWDGVRWDEREFSGTYHLRGKNRALAQRLGRPLCYDKAALLAVSILHLSHFRNDVTIASYILAKSAARKDG